VDVKIEYMPPVFSTCRPFQDILPVEFHIPNRESTVRGSPHQRFRRAASEDGAGLIVLALVLSANARNCSLLSSKARGLDGSLALSCHLTDKDRMVPYIVELLNDDAALVRSQVMSIDPLTLLNQY